MNTQTEALKLALKALETSARNWPSDSVIEAITAIKEALAQPEQEPVVMTKTWFEDGKVVTQHLTAKEIYKKPEQEPVAWMCTPFSDTEYEFSAHQECENCVPCYATPTKREGVKLTDEQIMDAFCVTPGIHQFVQAFKAGARYAEAAHDIKENT